MGGYWSKKDKEGGTSKEATDGSDEDSKKSKYKVVYTNREIKISELPRDLLSLFVLRRIG